MKKIICLTLLLLTLMISVCSAQVQKSYDEKNSRAVIRTIQFIPAAELDPDSTICVNMKKIYFFDSRFYDNSIGRYKPITYFTIALIGNAAEKFENNMSYTTNKGTYTLPMILEAKQNPKKQTVLASGTCEFKDGAIKNPFLEAIKANTPVNVRVILKDKKHSSLKCAIDGDVLKDMAEIALYDIYNDDNFLNIAQKANKSPK